jgi:hypothetical protein
MNGDLVEVVEMEGIVSAVVESALSGNCWWRAEVWSSGTEDFQTKAKLERHVVVIHAEEQSQGYWISQG